jgi:hypothetical protein
MNRFYGVVGYAEQSVESAPGVWTDAITEVSYYGNIVRNTRQLREGSLVNDDVTVGNNISIIADAYANENFMRIRYIAWQGSLWTVTAVEVQAPRLILTLGGLYNAPPV